jgi:acyl-CoA reductase-like NAD-dependent aldehyde dehydrogenase
MGKPLSEATGEVNTAIARAKALIELAPKALGDEEITLGGAADLHRRITKEPIGVVLSLVPWNYPLLCAVNTVITAVLAGNSVLLKHSDRTPLCADHFANAFVAAGAPKGLVQV